MKKLFCDNWQFAKSDIDTAIDSVGKFHFKPVDIPHDWLIYDVNKLYETSFGWYKKLFSIDFNPAKNYRIYFEGVYQDCTVYVNGKESFNWKYGYTSFEADITDFLKSGENEIIVLVRHLSPNSRWYSGAGIYRKLWFIETEKTHLKTDGVYFSAKKQGDNWQCIIDAEVSGSDYDFVKYKITNNEKIEIYNGEKKDINNNNKIEFELNILPDKIWDIENPILFDLYVELFHAGKVIDSVSCKIGFREINFDCDNGFFLNGKNVKIKGVCLHHDLGCLGAAFNREALKRQLLTMQEMGANAVRTSHNPPAVELMELCDEMGILVNSEIFDIWERQKTEFDYARFFINWYEKDVASWIRRDRNHPSLIMWSIGNEIYDTHASLRGHEVTKMLQTAVRKHDLRCNAYTTLGSNFLQWDNGQACAAEVDLAGYNYGEHLYNEHHKKYPYWKIYGSENTSGVKSRGVYHFPLDRSFLTHEDLQCSSLGNCKSGFDKLTAEDVIAVNRDTNYCAGMFIWTGTDYIGEPTPYFTKNSYFGPVDTAGIKKDAFYLYKAAWADVLPTSPDGRSFQVLPTSPDGRSFQVPVLHIMPYWDFNIGQKIDIVVYTNLKEVELFVNGKTLGKKLNKNYTLVWQTEYEKGEITAVAFDKNGKEIKAQKKSFTDSAEIVLNPGKKEILANGEDLFTVEISTVDKDGIPVENARNRICLSVEGARLLGFDNGDSTDYDQYKTCSRRLFSGKAAAYIAAPVTAGLITVTAESPGLKSASIKLTAKEAAVTNGISALENISIPCNEDCTSINEVPVRKIELIKDFGYRITPENKDLNIKAKILPENASYKDLNWSVVTGSGVKINNVEVICDEKRLSASLKIIGDGEFRLRCVCNNGKKQAEVISEYEFLADGFGPSVINPYENVPACFNNVKIHDFNEVSNGGIQIQGEKRLVGFNTVDFGKYGCNELEISAIHWFTDEPVKFNVWYNDSTCESKMPESKEIDLKKSGDKILLGEFSYQANFKWQTYQKNNYKLNTTLYGMKNIFFEFGETEQLLHFGNFKFIPIPKAYQKINASDYDSLHGDNYEISGGSILKIGNNVFIDYDNMDFSEGVSKLILKGRTRHDNDSVHIHFEQENGEIIREIIEFPFSDDFIEVNKPLTGIKGHVKVKFIFLPGCDFDFEDFIVLKK